MGAFQKSRNAYSLLMQIQERNYGQEEVGELLTNGWGDGPRMSPSPSQENKVYALGGKGNLVCVQI